jgi:hypothetical protein
MTAAAETLPVFGVTVIIWSLGEIGFNAVGPALIANIAPAELRGRYNGAVGVAFGAAAMLAPLLGTRIFEELGETVLWTSCFGVSVLSALIVLMLARAIRARRTIAAGPTVAAGGLTG